MKLSAERNVVRSGETKVIEGKAKCCQQPINALTLTPHSIVSFESSVVTNPLDYSITKKTFSWHQVLGSPSGERPKRREGPVLTSVWVVFSSHQRPTWKIDLPVVDSFRSDLRLLKNIVEEECKYILVLFCRGGMYRKSHISYSCRCVLEKSSEKKCSSQRYLINFTL